MIAPQVQLPDANAAQFMRTPLLAEHNLHDHELFSEAALVELLDRFPKEKLHAITMGSDPLRTDEHYLASHTNLGGAELLRAVQSGRLWLNIMWVDLVDQRYRDLVDNIYNQLSTQVPNFKPFNTHGTLLISSPNAMVHYHADGYATVLWHIRGRKRIWIYPALDERYLKREHLEDIIAGVRHEYAPYEHHFDEAAVSFELKPGQMLAWPHNAPHRVINGDVVNVSLTTEHFTNETLTRQRVYVANRFFRSRLGVTNLAARETGPMATAKILTHRVARKLGLDPLKYKHYDPAFKVNPDAPNGVAALTA